MGKRREEERRRRPRHRQGIQNVQTVQKEPSHEEEEEEESENTPLMVLEMLVSPHALDREHACEMVARLDVAEERAVPTLVRHKVVHMLMERLGDPTRSVQIAAAGALRNLSVEIGGALCDHMVQQGIVPTTVLFLREATALLIAPNTLTSDEERTQVAGFVTQLLALLWNLSETSELAVHQITDSDLATFILHNVLTDTEAGERAIVTAKFLNVITERNRVFCTKLQELGAWAHIERVLPASSCLLQVTLAGVLCNLVQPEEEETAWELTIPFLLCAMEFDVSTSLETLLRNTTKEQEDLLEENMELLDWGNRAEGCKMALELLTNFAASGDEEGEEEDEWEEVLDTDGGDPTEGESMQAMQDEQSCSTMHLDVRMHRLLVDGGVWKKAIDLASAPIEGLAHHTGNVSVSLQNCITLARAIRTRAMTLLGNLIAAIPLQALPNPQDLCGVLAVQLEQVAQPIPELAEVQESIMSTLFSLVQKVLSGGGSPAILPVNHLGVVLAMAKSSECPVPVRIPALGLLGAVGAKVLDGSTNLEIGKVLLSQIGVEQPLQVVSEALNALFDVYSEDHLNSNIVALNMLQFLDQVLPMLRLRVKKEKRELNARDLGRFHDALHNLRRFIQYKRERC